MKKTTIISALIIFSTAALAQTCLFDNMRGTYRVVTNEQDAVAIVAVTAEAALRASGDVKGTNYTDAVASGKVSTTDPAYLAACTGSVFYAGLTTYVSNRVTYIGTNAFTGGGAAQTNVSHNSLLGIGGAGTLHVTAADTNLIKTAWQNPASATNWTWTSDGAAITLTGYNTNAGLSVVIPDWLDGLPVTSFGTTFKHPSSADIVTCISGGANIASVSTNAFEGSAIKDITLKSVLVIRKTAFSSRGLTNAVFPSAKILEEGAFYNCTELKSVTMNAAEQIGRIAFGLCTTLTNIVFATSPVVGEGAFRACYMLNAVYFGQNAPAESTNELESTPAVYYLTPNVTNYVTNPQATGWGATWNGRPVVRLPVTSDLFIGSGAGVTNIPIAGVTGLQGALDGKVATNGMTDTIHGVRGGLNLHSLADANGAGFYSADHYKAVTSMKGRTNVWDSAVPSTPAGIAAAGGQLAETVVTGAVRTVTSGNRYFFTTATNVVLSASLTGGQVVNYAALRNTATNSITAVCESAGWKFTGGSLTNTLPANTMMTFGWSCNPFTGATNFYATAASSN
jgi:hypothetical protein